MAPAPAALPPDAEPPDDRWEFEPDADEDFCFDPVDDRKWEAFLLDNDELDPLPDDVVPL